MFLNIASPLSGSVTDAPTTAQTQPDNAGIAGVELAFEQRFSHGSPFVNGTLPASTLLYLPLDENNRTEGDLNNSYTVSFAGMMPAHDPAFVGVVVIDDPKTTKVSRYGGTIAAPAFGRIAARAATYLNLPPTEPVNPSLSKVVKP